MSQTATIQPGGQYSLDLGQTRRTPFARLVKTELRKSYDTRAGMWLLITIGLLTVVTVGIVLLVSATVDDAHFTLQDIIGAISFVTSVLLPILGILLVTSEWSQRTAMTTFTLEANRGRVIAAKLAVGVVLTIGVTIFAFAVASLGNLINMGIDSQASWDVGGGKAVLGFLIIQEVAMLSGFALAALLLNSPAAIVIYFAYMFVLPTVFGIAMALVDFFERTLPWVDFQSAQIPLYDLSLTGEELGRLLVSGTIWLVIPLALGVWRVLRAEVK